MQFQRLRLGGPGLLFAPRNTARLPFSFPAPIRSAYALLESFSLTRDEGDMSLTDLQVSLLPLFDPLQSTTDGQIQIDLKYTGSAGGLGIFPSPALIRAEIGILVIGAE